MFNLMLQIYNRPKTNLYFSITFCDIQNKYFSTFNLFKILIINYLSKIFSYLSILFVMQIRGAKFYIFFKKNIYFEKL